MSLLRNALVQTSFTLMSRLLGFARDVLLSARLGQGPLSDAFVTALMFPNTFRRLFAEGAFAQAFVPIYAKSQQTDGVEGAARIASEAMSFLMFAVAIFCIGLQLAMPWIMPVLASEYVDRPEILHFATLLTQITMPYLACMTLASLLSGVLNTGGRFALSAGAPILFNLSMLAVFFAIKDPRQAAFGASIAVTVSGLLQAGLLWWGVANQKINLRFSLPRFSPNVANLLKLAIPGVIAGGAMQLGVLAGQIVTGTDEGARTTLYNADRVYQLPLGLIGVAIGLALVPRLARSFAANDTETTQKSLDDGMVLALAFTIPASAALFAMAFFITDGIYTRGVFTSEHAARVADALRHFAWGMPAFVLVKVFTPPFLARQDTKTPMNFALISVAINAILGAGLFFGLQRFGIDGVIGIAIATSLAAWINVFLLTQTLANQNAYRISKAAWGRLVKVGLAALVMWGVLVAASFNRPLIEGLMPPFLGKELAVVITCLTGLACFGVAALGLRAFTIAELKSALRREKGPSLGDVME